MGMGMDMGMGMGMGTLVPAPIPAPIPAPAGILGVLPYRPPDSRIGAKGSRILVWQRWGAKVWDPWWVDPLRRF